jgi:hypothetical protein
MKKIALATFVSAMFLVSCNSTKTAGSNNSLARTSPIEAKLDLTKVSNDKVPVVINPGRFTLETVTYRLPRVVQGTYAVSDFGKYVDDFKAYDYKGNLLETKKGDINY